MAEPTVSTPNEPTASEEKPRLVAVDPAAAPGGAPEPDGAAPERRSRLVIWGLLALLVLAVAIASVQSQRLTTMTETNAALSEELTALEVQLSAATLQIQTFEMKEELVRTLAADLANRVGELQALVEPTPGGALPPPAEAP